MAVIGIDLGTTNSLVAVLRKGKAETLPNEMGEHLTPSAVAVAKDGATLVGRAAWDRIIQEPASGRAFFKRDMGTSTTYEFGGRRWTPTECSAIVLGEMKRIAAQHLESAINRAVITVPAYFHESQRQATSEAARLAGLTVERIVNEPTAAALAYGYDNPEKESRILVFDLGGGTFDVTVLEIFSGVIEVRASGGHGRLGGEDFTDALLDRLLASCGMEKRHPRRSAMRAQVEALKRRLSAHARAAVVLEGHELLVSRKDLEAAGAELVALLRPVILRCLRDANLEAKQLQDILLVGGASRMHMIPETLSAILGNPGSMKLDPDRVIAMGAAVQAALCEGNSAVKDLVLTDVCAHTLGVMTAREYAPGEIVPGYYEPLIERNTTVPVSRTKTLSCFSPRQDEVLVEVYQGESRMTKDNQLLGKLKVTGLSQPPGSVQPGRVELRFSYDMSGLLEVDATVMHTGRTFHTVIEQRPGALTTAQIEAIRRRLAPLKISPRDFMPNRARIERAQRLYATLRGEARQELSEALDQFEAALATQEADAWELAGVDLDIVLGKHTLEEGEWQPPGEKPGAS